METDLHISERLRKLLPPLTTDEKKQLKENIEADGKVRDVILYWHDGTKNVVTDGMHRWEIVRGTDTPYETEEMYFESYEDAELWILNHQLGRRNLLKPSDVRKLRGELYNRLKRKDGGHGNQRSGYQNDTPIETAAEVVATKSGVSPITVKRDGARVEAIEKLTKSARTISDKATDAEIKLLAKLSEPEQDTVARAVRTGQAKSVKEAVSKAGIAKPGKTIKQKTPEQSEAWQAQQVLKTWMDALGRWMNGNPHGIDTYRERFPGPKGDKVIEAAKALFCAIEAWKKVIK